MSRLNGLIIENSPVHAMAISQMFSDSGWLIRICPSLQAAFDTQRENDYHLVLSEIYFGEESSIDAFDDIRSTWPDALCGVMTAGNGADISTESALREAKDAEADYLLKKPLDLGTVGDIGADVEHFNETGGRLKHVLVVDDSETVRQFIANALRCAKRRVSLAPTMEVAIEHLTFDQVDVVISDIFMPGMGGIEGIRKIRLLFPEIGIIAVSGGLGEMMGRNESLKAASRVGADSCLPKPFEAETLAAETARVLAQYSAN